MKNPGGRIMFAVSDVLSFWLTLIKVLLDLSFLTNHRPSEWLHIAGPYNALTDHNSQKHIAQIRHVNGDSHGWI